MSWTDAAEVMKSVSIIVASGVAIWGINAWRREHVGKKKLDTAEEMLSMFYQARDAIREIRSPASMSGEAAARTRPPDETEDQARARDQAFIPFARYQRQSELFAKLKTLRYRAMAQFEPSVGVYFEQLDQIVREILSAAMTLRMLWEHAVNERGRALNLETQRKLEGKIWEGGDVNSEVDSITSRVDSLVTQVEGVARSKIDRAFSIWK